jgi:hypothetical protein
MKRLIVGMGLCAVLVAGISAQMPKYGVTVNTEKGVDYSKFTSYSWTPGQPSADKEIDSAIVASVDRALAGVGMKKAESGPGDVMVAYYSVSRTDVDIKGKTDEKGLKPQYQVGTLVVALLDPPTRKRLLRLRIDKPITVPRDQMQPVIDGAVDALFEKYPTRTKR